MLSTYSLKGSAQKEKYKKETKEHLPMDSEDNVRGSQFNEMSRQNRTDNTLGHLTKNFVSLIKNARDQIIEIDEASEKLGIQKRRIYDITNVLEGIGYIEKLGKNKMKWVGGQTGSELENEAIQLERKQEEIERETKKVQQEIEEMKTKLLALSKENSIYNFLRHEDLINIMKGLNVSKMIIYAGGVGDQVQNDSNPEKKTSQCTIESKSSSTRLYYCKLNDDSQIEIVPHAEDPEEFEERQAKVVLSKHSKQQVANQDSPCFSLPVASHEQCERVGFKLDDLQSHNYDKQYYHSRQQFFESDEDK